MKLDKPLPDFGSRLTLERQISFVSSERQRTGHGTINGLIGWFMAPINGVNGDYYGHGDTRILLSIVPGTKLKNPKSSNWALAVRPEY